MGWRTNNFVNSEQMISLLERYEHSGKEKSRVKKI